MVITMLGSGLIFTAFHSCFMTPPQTHPACRRSWFGTSKTPLASASPALASQWIQVPYGAPLCQAGAWPRNKQLLMTIWLGACNIQAILNKKFASVTCIFSHFAAACLELQYSLFIDITWSFHIISISWPIILIPFQLPRFRRNCLVPHIQHGSANWCTDKGESLQKENP